jgi:hypothetical protein
MTIDRCTAKCGVCGANLPAFDTFTLRIATYIETMNEPRAHVQDSENSVKCEHCGTRFDLRLR